ncbi:MAG: hypothetical protein ISS69_09220 [Phycisphaerae bacterium]|nr:hypothetical protein [Phycisphaerae bacterium]
MTRQLKLLIGTGIAAAILWRVELELHGWDGLIWIGYFHWAIPVGAVLFLGWLFSFSPIVGKIRRGAFVLTTAIVSIIWFQVVMFALYYHFNTGPSAFVEVLSLGDKTYTLYANTIHAVVPATPLIFAGLLCVFGLTPKAKDLTLGVLVYILACPVSIVILAVLDHRGGVDAIHTIKSGVIIPFLVIGLGILVPKKEKGQHSPAGDVLKTAPEE